MNRSTTCKRREDDHVRCPAVLGLLGLLAFASTSLAGDVPSQPAPDGVRSLPASATIRFAGTSTLHDFEGQLGAQPFHLILSNGTWSATGRVRVADMGTANVKRDRRMLAMLDAVHFPEMRADLPPSPVPAATESTATLHFRIGDVVQPVPVRISEWTEDSQTLRFTATWDLSLKAFRLTPPSVAGIIRVGDSVHVEAHVTASPSTLSSTVP